MTFRLCTHLVALFSFLLLVLLPGSLKAADTTPYEILSLLPLTGGGAFQGREQSRTLSVLEEYINHTGGVHGRPIKFNIVDTQGSPQLAVQIMNDAAAKKLPVVLGPAFTAECAALAAIVKNGPVDYCTSPGMHPDPGSYVFSSGFSTVDLISIMVKYLRERGFKRVAIVSSTDATGQDGERSIDAALGAPLNKDMLVVAREHFAPADLNATAQITRVKAASPQVVIVWTTGAPFGTVLRNIREIGLEAPVATTPGNQTYEQMSGYAPFLPKELLFATGPFSAPDQITDRTTRSAVALLYSTLDTVKARPGFPSQVVWDPAQLIIAMLRKLGTDVTATQVRDYIAGQRAWIGENGRYDFVSAPQRGLDGSSSMIVRWDTNKNTWVAASKLGGTPL
jgi:branched-chain amino acid transport system substrate-binding protein